MREFANLRPKERRRRVRGISVFFGVLATLGILPAVAAAAPARRMIDHASAVATAATIAWRQPHDLEARGSRATGISCATTSFCMLVDASGSYEIRRHGRWSKPHEPNAAVDGFSAVSCYARGRCTAIVAPKTLYRFDRGRWTLWRRLPDDVFRLDCLSDTMCGAAGAHDAFVIARGLVERRTLLRGNNFLTAVACGTRRFCMFIGQNRAGAVDSWKYAYGRWTAPRRILNKPYDNFWAIDCVGTKFCLAAGDNGISSRFDGQTWHQMDNEDTSLEVESLSCTSAQFCIAAGMSDAPAPRDVAQSWMGHRWGRIRALSSYDNPEAGVGCAQRARWCQIVAANGIVQTWQGKRLLAAHPRPDPAYGDLQGVSCASPSLCIATADNMGYAVFNGRWGRLHQLPTTASRVNFDAVSSPACGAPDACVVREWSGRVHELVGQRWHSLASTPFLWFGCGAAHFCAGIDATGHGAVLARHKWRRTATQIMPRNHADSVDCTRSFCMAVDDSGHYATYLRSTGRWSGPHRFAPRSVSLYGNAVSCTSRMFCMEVDGSGFEAVWSGSKWRRIADPGGYTGTVSCIAADFCVAGANGDVVEWDGSGWGAPTTVMQGDEQVESISCTGAVGSAVCVAGGWRHVVVGVQG